MEIITKKHAKELGLVRYFTGKPCKKGHVAERHVKTGGCIPCRLEFEKNSDSRDRYAKSGKGILAYSKAQSKYNKTDKSRARVRRWADENPEKIKNNYLLRKQENPLSLLLAQAKQRAKRKGQEFNIDSTDLIIPDSCPILKIPLFVGENKHCGNSPSIDRIDPLKGYVKNNVQIISYRANMLKNNGTLSEFKLLVEFLKNSEVMIFA